jgi:hypothetical protein
VPVPGRRRSADEPPATAGDTTDAERGAGRRRAADDDRHGPGLNGTPAIARVDGLNGAPTTYRPATPADGPPHPADATRGPAPAPHTANAPDPRTATGGSAGGIANVSDSPAGGHANASHGPAGGHANAPGGPAARTADATSGPDPRSADATGGPARGSATATGRPLPRPAEATGGPAARTADATGGPAPRPTDPTAGPAPRTADPTGGPASRHPDRTVDGPPARPEGSPWTERAVPPQPRAAAGWATIPTSGIPTLTTTDRPETRPAAATPAEAAAAGATPPADSAATRPRRSASLEDADQMPRTETPRTETPRPAEQAHPRPDRPTRTAADGMPRAGRRAVPESADTALRPGDVNQIQIAFWDEEAIAHYRSAWHELRGDFVDDPVTALTRAHDLLTEAVNELTEALLAERDELDPLRSTATPDTESMRMAMRGYREFLERILAL